MRYARFVAYDMAGSLIWALAYLLAGRFFGDLAKRSSVFFTMLGHFAVVIFVLMVLGLMAHKVWKQRKFLTSGRELRLEPAELLQMIETADSQGNIPPFIIDLRHPLDYLPEPTGAAAHGACKPGRSHGGTSRCCRANRDVILYCTWPSEETSAKVALQLHKFGINRVRPLRGGFEGWRDAGYPLLDYDPPPEAVALTEATATAAA